MSKRTMLILRGLPGAGKSYIATQLMEAYRKQKPLAINVSARANADAFFDAAEIPFTPIKLKDAHHYSMGVAARAVLDMTMLVIVDNTNTRLWEFKPYMDLAKKFQYEVRVIRIMCSEQVAFERCINKVPKDKILEMSARFEDYPGEMKIYQQIYDLNQIVEFIQCKMK